MNTPTVVILLSDKRSGSTIFQSELCKHKDIQTVEHSPHTYLETHHWLKGAVMMEMHPKTFSCNKVYAGYGSKEGAKLYMIDCIKENVPNFIIPKNNRELIFRGWDALCTKFAQPVFFEKSPQFLAHWGSLSLLLDWIETTDYQVKIIGLTRNPMSVMYSATCLTVLSNCNVNPGSDRHLFSELECTLLPIFLFSVTPINSKISENTSTGLLIISSYLISIYAPNGNIDLNAKRFF